MKAQMLDILLCPASDCMSADLILEAHEVETIQYNDGPVEEVKEGTILCASCGRKYPVAEYVPDFSQLFPGALKSEADFWNGWYGFMWDKKHLGFFDHRETVAPFLTSGVGVLDPARLQHQDMPGIHTMIEAHPLMRSAKRLLEIGCGTGWNTLYFARQGHNVVAFDPASRNVQLAKRYAVSQGEYVEYMCAAQGYVAFKPEVFDGVIAFHSLHHIPHLRHELNVVRSWLGDGGVIGVDEHIRNEPILEGIRDAMLAWAEAEVFPKYRDADSEGDLSGLPTASHSELEGAGSEDVLEAVLDNFELAGFSSRFYGLDAYAFLQYLAYEQDEAVYYNTAYAVDRLYKLYSSAFPEKVELVTLIARKVDAMGAGDARTSDEVSDPVMEARAASGKDRPNSIESLKKYVVELQGIVAQKNKQIEELEEWARSMERGIAEQMRLIKRIESGRVMRLLNMLPGNRKRP